MEAAEKTHMGRCVCCDCSSRGAGLTQGERAGERVREGGEYKKDELLEAASHH
ncbi:hypothetical protein PAMP_013477 [Pampus punctatissimus]